MRAFAWLPLRQSKSLQGRSRWAVARSAERTERVSEIRTSCRAILRAQHWSSGRHGSPAGLVCRTRLERAARDAHVFRPDVALVPSRIAATTAALLLLRSGCCCACPPRCGAAQHERKQSSCSGSCCGAAEATARTLRAGWSRSCSHAAQLHFWRSPLPPQTAAATNGGSSRHRLEDACELLSSALDSSLRVPCGVQCGVCADGGPSRVFFRGARVSDRRRPKPGPAGTLQLVPEAWAAPPQGEGCCP